MTQKICKHFNTCGGCQTLDTEYSAQVSAKQAELKEILKDFWTGDIPVTQSDAAQYYRNKVELSFSHQVLWKEPFDKKVKRDKTIPLEFEEVVGFKLKGRWDRGFDLEECIIFEPYLPALLAAVRNWAKENNLSYYDQRKHTGLLRNLMLRQGKNTGQKMVVLYASGADFDKQSFVKVVENVLPDANILLALNSSVADAAQAQSLEVLKGQNTIMETLKINDSKGEKEIKFSLSTQSFFQTNTLAAQKMYQKVHDLTAKINPAVIYDLYGGAGSFSLTCGAEAEKCFCVENVPSANIDGAHNAKLNNVSNIDFICAKVEDFVKQQKINAEDSLIIIDPPRSGLHPDAEKAVANSTVKNIIYISCNPVSLAQNLAGLTQNYKIKNVEAFDFFPNTKHIETLVELELKVPGVC